MMQCDVFIPKCAIQVLEAHNNTIYNDVMTWNMERAGGRVNYLKKTITNKQQCYTYYIQGNIINTTHC